MSRRESTADGPVSLRTMPRWYVTLFCTDTLERFGFYGMQAILVLYAAAPESRGGLGLATGDAAALFGAWISVMFLLSLPGGWLGDRVLGQRRALLAGCLISGFGYVCLAVPAGWTTAAGLVLLAAGGGLFKPNHQAMVNLMFAGRRGRESGISLMYVGVQVSALIAPLLTGYLGERVSWHLAFSIASVAVLLTAALLAGAAGQFHDVGGRPERPLTRPERVVVARRTGSALLALAGLLTVLWLCGVLSATTAIVCASVLGLVIPVVGYVVLYRNPALGAGDRRRLKGFLAVFLGATLFWMIIAHAASLLNLFARDHTDLTVFGFGVPASWLQSATPLFILVIAPLVAVVLPRFGERYQLAVKFAVGLLLVGGGFLVMAVAAANTSGGAKVSPLWLIAVYLMHACGEVVIAAVTISSAADVLPKQFMGRILGMLWLFAALGGGLGSALVRLGEVVPESVYYLGLGGAATLAGAGFALYRRSLSRALAKDSSPYQQTEPVPAREM
ncbi:peptide MFS transporter [Kibdelosporangium persicum]|uniref:Peptide transporter n=1 Tax=Kibdelosporangium persicum TaxID=2698649 RepID=A0ABX2FHX4_9PSEU|nr:oligopeptide:H+ symporter [Kibdelosporangium persicum]NRN71019.1 Peptide transporter [Kibdelosporangium persicum]